jgi:hypothetical protein
LLDCSVQLACCVVRDVTSDSESMKEGCCAYGTRTSSSIHFRNYFINWTFVRISKMFLFRADRQLKKVVNVADRIWNTDISVVL